MTHDFRWNVSGPHFDSLRRMFMGQYTEQWNAIDVIAERIRAPGHPDPGATHVVRKAEPVIHAAVISTPLELRLATGVDLGAVNAVIERAVMTWKLPERVKRLAMPGYRYAVHDLKYLHIVVAEDRVIGIVGVAAWESAAVHECPQGCRGLQLHGIYVDPDRQQRGVGARLLSAAGTAARGEGYDGLLVKAQADAEGFFGKQGLQKLPLVHPDRDYPRRYWLDLAQRQVASGRSDACAARPRDESRADDPS